MSSDALTRDVVNSTYRAVSPNNPPPLHVRADCDQAAWFPLPRPYVHDTHPGPLMVLIPSLAADAYGEDPTDPARQSRARVPTGGMVERLNLHAGKHNIGPGGARL